MTSFCDDRCTNAKGESCDCECGGANHGGFTKAVDRSGHENPLILSDKELQREYRDLEKRLDFVADQIDKVEDQVDSATSDPSVSLPDEATADELRKEQKSVEARLYALEQEKERRELGGPEVGSVSTGTLRNGDLLHSFRSALEDYDAKSYRAHMAEFPDLNDVDGNVDDENVDYAVEDLEDRLNEVAPPGTYFGSHPGDGADFGFWLDEE